MSDPGWIHAVLVAARPRVVAALLRVFRDHGRYYVNLQQTQPAAEPASQTSFIVSDTPLPCVHLSGFLAAFDAVGGRSLQYDHPTQRAWRDVAAGPWICFFFFWALNMIVIWRGIETIKFLEGIGAPFMR